MGAAWRRPYCVPLSVMVRTPEQNNVKESVYPNLVVSCQMFLFVLFILPKSMAAGIQYSSIQMLYLSSTTTVEK